MEVVPERVAVGNAFTVTTAVCTHPLELVYVMVVVPEAIPFTSPVLETVATAVLEDVHGLVALAVGEPVNCVVAPAQTVRVPVMEGSGLMVTTAVL